MSLKTLRQRDVAGGRQQGGNHAATNKPSHKRAKKISKWLCKEAQGNEKSGDESVEAHDDASGNIHDGGLDQPSELAHAGNVYGMHDVNANTRVKNQLILVSVRIFGRNVVALIDSGATHNFISAEFCKRAKLELENSSVREIQLANGATQKSGGKLHNARVVVGKHGIQDDFIAMSMKGEEFEMILGKPWLTVVNPQIDWSKNVVEIGESTIKGVSTPGHFDFKVCSLKTIKKAQRVKGARSWSILVRVVKEDGRTSIHLGEPNASVNNVQEPSPTPYSPSLDPPDWKPVQDKLANWPELLDVIESERELFEPLPDGNPIQTEVTHKIDLKEGATPPYRPPYRMSPLELAELKSQIEGLLKKGWIRPSHSPFGSPVLFAAKPDGSLRLCIDYRALNALTKKSRYPLPRIDEMFDRMTQANYITSADAAQAYHQVGIDPGDVHKTAFVCRYGQYEWIVMPFGLCNAPSTFQSLINKALGSDFDDCVMAYLDDIIIFSRTKEDHVRDVKRVLERLKKYNIRLRLSKCNFGAHEVEFLGFVVGGGVLKAAESKIKVVQTWSTPKNVHDVRSFLGFCNFYRRFVEGYSKIAAPLNELLRKDVAWCWEEQHKVAFQALKDALTNPPVLILPDWSKPFYVVVDASDYAVGATLMQDQGRGLQPIAFDGRKLNDAERKYITTDRENLALIHALRNWRCYLEGSQFTVETDHHALIHLQTQPQLNRRQVGWMELLASYTFDIVHKPGKSNVSDPLSRIPHEREIGELNVINASVGAGHALLQSCREGYAHDDYYANPANLRQFHERDGVWYWKERVCVPDVPDLRNKILVELHDAPTGGHFGVDKTLEAISRRFFWPSLKHDVRTYVRTCPTCQRTKHTNQVPAGLLQPIPAPDYPYEQVTMDLITNLPKTSNGHDACVVFVDRLSKTVKWEPCTHKINAEGTAIMYLNHVVRHHGVPKVIISDRDPRFLSHFWQEVQRILGTKLKMSTAGHAQTDGQSEVANKMLLQLLRSYAGDNPRNWDEHLAMAELAYNSSLQQSTGTTPFYALYGRHPKLPIDHELVSQTENKSVDDLVKHIHSVWESVGKHLGVAQERQAKSANRRRRHVAYAVGDKVLVATKIFKLKMNDVHKVVKVWQGPFEVVRVPGPVNVELSLPAHLKTHKVVHVSKVRPWYEVEQFGDRGKQPSFELIDGEPEYEVEALLDRKIVRRVVSYLVKWKGYDHCENMWIKRSWLNNAMDLVREYERRHPL